MTPTPAQLAAAERAWFATKESGPSPTRDHMRFIKAIAEALLADLPEPHPRRLGG